MNDLLPVIFRLLEGIFLIIIGWVLAWVCNKAYVWLKLSRPLSRILGTIADDAKDVTIVVPKLYSPPLPPPIMLKQPLNMQEQIQWNSKLALFAEGDARAMMYLYNLLLKLGKKVNRMKIKSDVELSGKEKEKELICIGAGSNSISKDFLTTVDPRINFEQGTIKIGGKLVQVFGLSIIDRKTKHKFVANKNDDYGLIVKLRNPSNSNVDVMILAGLGPSGTAGAGYYLSNKWKEIYDRLRMKNAFNRSYEVLLKTKQSDHTDLDLIKVVII